MTVQRIKRAFLFLNGSFCNESELDFFARISVRHTRIIVYSHRYRKLCLKRRAGVGVGGRAIKNKSEAF